MYEWMSESKKLSERPKFKYQWIKNYINGRIMNEWMNEWVLVNE